MATRARACAEDAPLRTSGTQIAPTVRVGLREWPMPLGRGTTRAGETQLTTTKGRKTAE